MQGERGGPDGFEGLDVFGMELEMFAADLEHGRVAGLHLAIFFGHERVGFFCAREDFFAILRGNDSCGGVLIEERSARSRSRSWMRCFSS